MKRLLTASLLAAVCSLPHWAHASGGDGFSANRFASEYQVAPAFLQQYAAGNLGVVPGSYWRVFHYMAYQAAKGKPLTQQQLAALDLNEWRIGKGSTWDYSYEADLNGSGAWLKERAAYAKQWGLPLDVKLDVMGETDNASYVNCHFDAFKQAAVTLKARAALGAGGKPDAWHKAWLQGQDAVFANCAEPPHEYGKPLPKRVTQLPPAPPANAPDWLKADYAYQSGAAHFYARNFGEARKQFQAVAQDSKSPWKNLGAYLAARCLIRSATLDDEGKSKISKLQQARKELEALAPTFAPARQLLPLVDARIDPLARIAALARQLDSEPFNADTPRLLSDYLVLMDKQPRSVLLAAKEPMTAWIATMQANVPADVYSDPDSNDVKEQRKHALEGLHQRWLKAQAADPLWLAPLVSLAGPGELNEAERKAAQAVPAKHPLYLTVQYHLARLELAEKQGAQADKDIDRLLATYGKTMSIATHNRFLGLKMASAGTLDEFVKAAQRKPDGVDNGEAIDAKAVEGETDEDFPLAVFRYLPLSELKTLLAHPRLPAKWKAPLQETMLARALILNDEATALSLLDAVAKGRKTTEHLYARYRNAKPGDERKLAGALLLVNTPELNPKVYDGFGASRDWGCAYGAKKDETPPAPQPPRYLTSEQVAAAAQEQQAYMKLPLRSEFMAPPLLAWAKTKPADDEAPKALHFLVASTRMECPYGTDKEEKDQLRGRYSKEAFQLLHKNWPGNKWAKATRYHF
ncbi:hypothetical protein GCM10027277_21890 [Pseudoduganella ginsengisoli]|uniref:Tetratricopeptide repeat protein n=1 Tax=Pseudoduganella ginsengisoli TaxID=1462440 RepID=A0A6L6PSZ7_9BURK|nr:hypothetical protein [Pseudoduganella ginsengisoli]MTW00557.1 hypothetical protein [Pseudoduganella ginsengisoli]